MMAEETPSEPTETWRDMSGEGPEAAKRRECYVEKRHIPVVLRLMNYRIEGVMHVTHKHRILDILNNPEPFLPITHARVYNGATGALMAETDFIAINKEQIVLLREDHAPGAEDESIHYSGGALSGVFEEPDDEDLPSVRMTEEPADG